MMGKKWSRGLSLLVLPAVLVGIFVNPARANDANPIPIADRQIVWTEQEFPHFSENAPANFGGKEWMGYAFLGGISYTGFTTMISAHGIGPDTGGILCDTTLSCLSSTFPQLHADGAFEVCSVEGVAPCVEGIEYKVGEGEFTPAVKLFTANPAPSGSQVAEFMRRDKTVTAVQTKFGWTSIEIPGVPASASGPSVYSFPGATNSGGADTYLVEPTFTFDGQKDSSGKVNGTVGNFQIKVRPVVVDKSKSGAVGNYQWTYPNGSPGISTSTTGVQGNTNELAYIDKNSVGYAVQFPKNIIVKVKLRLPVSIGGWFQGRADSPNITVESAGSGENLVTLEAKPTVVPITATDYAIFDPVNKDIADAMINANDSFMSKWKQDEASGLGGFGSRSWSQFEGTKPFGLFSRLLGEKAKGFISDWEFQKLNSSNQCMRESSSLQGVLTTNATTYQAELPQYKDGFLNYSVAGLHYDSDGKVFQGTYSFIMKDTVARCLYGFKGSGPISGTIAITSADGSENVAYTNVTDDGNWLKLTAQGFTFSNPTISAKLTQATDPIANKPADSKLPVTATKSLLCVKGKVVRQVTGSAPKCPAGYKKK